MVDLVRFWLDLGFDGFRLDAVPYLFQADGTAGEHLPETHAFIRRIRKQLEADYPDASCSPRPTAGPRTWPTTSATATSATCASTPPDAPALHGRAARAALPDHRDPEPDA